MHGSIHGTTVVSASTVTVDKYRLVRGVGWVSIGFGLALIAAPARTTRILGLGERRGLGLTLGVRDLILGAGLLRGEHTTFWLWARAFSDVADAALLTNGAVSGDSFHKRAAFGAVAALAFSAFGFALARRLG